MARCRLVLLWLLVAAVAVSVQAATTSVIVELQDDPAAVAQARTPMNADQIESYRGALRAKQDAFLAALAANGVAFAIDGVTVSDVRIDYRYTLVYNGISLTVPTASIATIKAMSGVKDVHPVEVYEPLLDRSVKYIRAPEVYGVVHELSQFDDFREGYEGQGMYVSVIDTGIDHAHEMFGGDPTPPRLGVEPPMALVGRNQKIVYYLPFVDVLVEDGFGHGTHVASTAAGYQGFTPGPDGIPLNDDDVKIHGVAPQAKLLSYKVCSDIVSTSNQVQRNVGGCLGNAIIMSIEDSVSPRTVNGFPKPVAHVINMSLGGSGTPNSANAVAASNAALLGTIVVAAAGNSGASGEGTVGAPSVGRRVISVGNNTDPGGDNRSADVLDPASVSANSTGVVTPASGFPAASGQRQKIRMHQMTGTPAPPEASMAQYYVLVAEGTTPTTYPAAVRGRIALVNSATGAFANIANSAAAAGAVAIVLRSTTTNPTAVRAPIPSAVMLPADFDYLKTLINGSATPPDGAVSSYPIRLNPFSGANFVALMNNTSSRGPVSGYGQVKPDLSAPGTNILAAVPPVSVLGALSQGFYGAISGTSMASPHVAGAATLLKQAHPTWTPDIVRTVLINTSTNLRDQNGVPKSDPSNERILDQGAGLIDVYHAMNAKALMGVVGDGITLPSILGSHSFGEVPAVGSGAIVTRSVDVEIRDLSATAGVYTLSVANNRNLDLAGIGVAISPSEVALPANGRATFRVTVSIDGRFVASGAPLQLQWYVRAARQDGAESIRMPFYLRATQSPAPPALQNDIRDDAHADQENGVDRDGRYVISWSYPFDQASPCGFRVEEATTGGATGQLFFDNADEAFVQSGNSKWSGANWTSKPHPGTLSLGYSPIYLDNRTVALQLKQAIALPAFSRVTLTFDSFEDIEGNCDCDYAFVDVSSDGGATFTPVAKYSGSFSGVRSVDLSSAAGTSAIIRFRLVTDPAVSTPEHLGWTIDNIRVQAVSGFTPIATVGASESSYEVFGRGDGSYSYRVVSLFGDCAGSHFTSAPSNLKSISVQVVPTYAPTASFTAAPNPARVGEAVSFDGSASGDNDSVGSAPAIASYFWSFGDGETAAGSTASHSYAATGTYRVSLTVVDNDGESSSSEGFVQVANSTATISGAGFIPVANGKATFGFDFAQSLTGASGTLSYSDHAARVKIQSKSITSITRIGNRATIHGTCSVNKGTATDFTLTVVDQGVSGDTLSIETATYSASGTVAGGDISVEN